MRGHSYQNGRAQPQSTLGEGHVSGIWKDGWRGRVPTERGSDMNKGVDLESGSGSGMCMAM